MKDSEFAAELVERLNELLEYHPEVRQDISALFLRTVSASHHTVLHPSLQVPVGGNATLGILGLLNGAAGTVKEGKYKGQGLISSFTNEDGSIERFELTENL